MAVSGLSGIESMLTQMRAAMLAAQGGTGVQAPAATVSGAGFAGELQRSLARVSGAQAAAKSQAAAFELGAPNVSLNDVMVDLQKANIGFQTAVQVRNRLVAAYKEISSMSV